MATSKNKTLTLIFFLTAIVVIMGANWYAIINIDKLINQSQWISHTRKVITTMGKAEKLTGHMDMGYTGFLLTNDEKYLETFFVSEPDLTRTIEDLVSFTQDNPKQQIYLDSLKHQLRLINVYVHSLIETYRQNGQKAVVELLRKEQGRQLMKKISTIFNQMEQEEDNVLTIRTKANLSEAKKVHFIQLVGTLIMILFLMIAYLFMQKAANNRIKAERKTRETASDMDLFFSLLPGLSLIAGFDGKVRKLNDRWREELGYSHAELDAISVYALVHPDDKRKAKAAILGLYKGKEVSDLQLRMINKAGESHWCVWMAASNLKRKLIYASANNIHELKLAQKQAEAATRAKSLFLASMGHEIRTPMNAVLGYSEIIAKRITDPALKEYLKSMQSSGHLLMNLLNDLLDFSKVESGQLALHPETTDIRYITNDIESVFRLKTTEKNLDFEIYVSKKIPTNLYVDELRLRQILLNLVSNAVKFTDKGKITVKIEAQNQDDRQCDLILSISDTGKGIAPEFHKKIFKQFEQQDNSIARKYGGTGLGLAITYQIVKLMHGDISVESEEGKGSTFRVYLPRIPISDSPGSKIPLSSINPDNLVFEPAVVLIVDDTPNNINVLKSMLEEMPFTLLEAQNGQQALGLMGSNKIDLVLMDIRMPVMDGNEAIQIIRTHHEWSHIPVIAITASSTAHEEKNILKEGFNAYIQKPVTFRQVVGALVNFLKFSLKERGRPEEFVLSDEARKNLPKLFMEIETQVMPMWMQLQKIRPRSKVKAMAYLLIELGKTNAVKPVIKYGEDLLSANQNFLFEREKNLIDGFVNFVKLLKAQT